MAKTIGIDLGTTNSVVAVMEGGDPVIIANEEGNRTTPSVVAWDAHGDVMVGQIARRQAVTNPKRTVYSIKRLMGRKHGEVSDELKGLPYEVICASNGDAQVSIDGKALAPPEISAMVLIKLKKAAEAYLGEKVGSAVITVPAYFNDAQRQATKDAGRIAGLNVERIVNEPTAAALAYGLDKSHDQIIAVYDFGGGTFDISVLEVGDGVVQVISTNGDTHLGGDNIDQLLIEHLCAEFRRDTGLDVSKDPMVIQRLKDAAERAKIELSSLMEAQINLPFLTADASGPKHLDMRLSRAKFEDMIAPLVERTLEPVRRALTDAKRSAKDIDEVVLVGGSTRIPLVQKRVAELFGKEPHKGVNPDEVVALGAAVQAGVLTGEVKDLLLLDVTPLSLGVETLGAVMTVMIPRNTTIPAKKTETYSTAVDSQTSVEIHVLQGERSMAAGNRTLGKFHLEGIMPAPRGVPKVEVTFDIDANGIVNVSAKDAATGKEQRITITASSGLAEQDIQRMVTDAEQHAGEDEQRRKEIETRNRAEQLVYTTERTLNELRTKLPSTEVAKVESAIADLKRSIEANDAPLVARNLEALTAASHKLAELAYQQPATAVPSQNGTVRDQGFGRPPEEIIDADFNVSAP